MSGRPMSKLRVQHHAIRILMTVIALSVMLLASSAANAQILYGSITGTVTDKTGAVIPNVTVSIIDQGTGAVRTDQSNGSGMYNILNVLPGVYTLSVAKTGNFAGFSQKDIQLEVNRQVRVDVMLQPASVSTQITVTEAPPALQTETAEVNSEISQTQLSQMPETSSQGRSFQALYALIPGAASPKEQNSTASNPSRAMSINVNGMSMNGNTTRIDGAVNYYGWLTYLIAYVPPVDSIENVSITTNDFTAEQGQAGGASIKITTKSGGHDFHGAAWEYYQSAGINARSYLATVTANKSAIDPTGGVLHNVFNEYGFNLGGPVYIPKLITGRKKLFFFDNWERTTRHQLIGNGVTLTVPDTNMINGNFSEVAGLASPVIIYDPQPTAAWVSAFTPTTACPTLTYTAGYLNAPCRPSFTSEYGETGSNVNTIPASRQMNPQSTVMIANLASIASTIGTPSTTLLSQNMANDYTGSAPFVYARTSNDAKVTYIPNDNTQIFGKYSTEPFQVLDPQELGAAGGGTFDGGQPGAGHGHIQNVGMGMSHVINANTVLDADFGYTRVTVERPLRLRYEMDEARKAAGVSVRRMRLSCRKAMRSLTSKADPMSWVTTTEDMARSCRSFRISSLISPAVMGSSPAVGSSYSMICGSRARARARPTRFLMPPEMSVGSLPAASATPTWASRAMASSRRGAGARSVWWRRGNSTFSATVRESYRAAFWKTNPMRLRMSLRGCSARVVSSWPSTWMDPESGHWRPIRWRSSTLLPVPLRPSTTRVSPRATWRLTSRSTAWVPKEVHRSLIRSAGPAGAAAIRAVPGSGAGGPWPHPRG